jgi:hypothetical protein
MDDQKVRDLLRRHRPVSPPASLRDRALAGNTARAGMWPLTAAAAALLAAAIGLQVATNRALGRVLMPVTIDPVGALIVAMGGGEEARRAAQLVVAEQLIRDAGGQREASTATLEDMLNGSR